MSAPTYIRATYRISTKLERVLRGKAVRLMADAAKVLKAVLSPSSTKIKAITTLIATLVTGLVALGNLLNALNLYLVKRYPDLSDDKSGSDYIRPP